MRSYSKCYFTSWADIIDSSDCDNETSRQVKIVDADINPGITLIDAINHSVKVEQWKADVILITANRSKGLVISDKAMSGMVENSRQ